MVHRSYTTKPKYTEIMPGVPEDYKQVKTLGDLLKINYKHVTVEEQMRGNLIAKLKKGEHPYPGIIGYDDDVIPAVNRAILSGHDLLLVGQIGQAKTKIAEAIAKNLLSPIPVVRGTVTNDIPTSIPEDQLTALLSDSEVVRTQPEFTVSPECEDIIRSNKLETKIDWISGADRYKYILSTPDISVKDLVGQIDAIKIAKKGVELYSMESYSAGQLLQARHGILCIDELPVLDPRKQVSLLSVLQEGKFTTGAYPAVFKPDVKIIATANPIDYTHSGKIIEPLFDRLRSHVDTHYPRTVEDEMLITVQESRIADAKNVMLPVFIVRTIAKITQMTRAHHDVNHNKGVSVRMSVHSMEMMIGEAERTRSITFGVKAIPRFCDIHCIHQSSKFELAEMEDTRENRKNVLDSIIESALKEVALEYIQKLAPEQLIKVKNDFAKNKAFQVSQALVGSGGISKSPDYESQLAKFPGLKAAVNETIGTVKDEQKQLVERAKQLGIRTDSILFTPDLNGEFTAAVTEVILEGLRHTQPPILDRKDNSYGLAQ
ncbi:putative Mg-chelatase subunit [Candidatus Nitrososphaera gargensis Ga9.2]|uniref:Putative Mg-chelatase subunit n=2 Tax=Candidatus Nitrososphaera gargensis TaxID=497727 RepID=K0IGX7_NITGG|nr:putative Mg-chelatase subunit [Candidatus Nitrososphaera gargensis Ga9.2]